jgi:membrane protein implicated in regulation of membrane protease activity
MIGEIGVVKQPVVEGLGGLVFAHGERWRAVLATPEDGSIRAGAEVEVGAFRGGALVVRPFERSDSGETS